MNTTAPATAPATGSPLLALPPVSVPAYGPLLWVGTNVGAAILPATGHTRRKLTESICVSAAPGPPAPHNIIAMCTTAMNHKQCTLQLHVTSVLLPQP